MGKEKIVRAFNGVKRKVAKHSPEILTGVGIAGMVTTVVLAVKATPKALELIEEERQKKVENATVEEAMEWSENGGIPMKPLEIVKITWKQYIPAAVTGVASIACILGSNSIHTRRHAALYSAYKLSETAYSEYKDKVVETIGEKKEKQIQEKISEDHIRELNFHEADVHYTGNGNTLFLDPISKTVFKSSKVSIENTINKLNYEMNNGFEPFISFDKFCDAINIPHYDYVGTEIGWSNDRGLIDIIFVPAETNAGEPCFEMSYQNRPDYGFDTLIR